jgi:cystathionine gamma-synthase
MSAVSSALLALLSAGDHMVTVDDAYKKTLHLCSNVLPRFGIGCSIVPMGDYERMEAAITEKTVLLYSESPTNPYLNIADFRKLTKMKERHGLILVIDSTFGTPYNQKPAGEGADIVIHSATKYLGGHNDLLAGAVLGSRETVEKVRDYQGTVGGIIGPHTAYLLLRGLKTFALRMAWQNESGMEAARFLETSPAVKHVYYPGLESHRHHLLAARQMRGFGGVVSFELDAGLDGVNRFLDALELCRIGPSLGGAETLITHPASISYYDTSREERYSLGIIDGLVRLAVGIEDPRDIIEDLRRGIGSI